MTHSLSCFDVKFVYALSARLMYVLIYSVNWVQVSLYPAYLFVSLSQS